MYAEFLKIDLFVASQENAKNSKKNDKVTKALKVRKSQKQFVVSSILSKNKQKSLSYIQDSDFLLWKNWGHHNLLSRLSDL